MTRMDPHTRVKVAAQVAVESIIDDPEAFEPETRAAVLWVASKEGVADLYLDMLRKHVEETPAD